MTFELAAGFFEDEDENDDEDEHVARRFRSRYPKLQHFRYSMTPRSYAAAGGLCFTSSGMLVWDWSSRAISME